MPTTNSHVLVVDDEEELCDLLALRLRHEGFRPTTCTNLVQARESMREGAVDAILLDLMLDGSDGLEFLDEVQKQHPHLPVIVLTAHGTLESAVQSMKRGAYGFLTKPFDDHELIRELRHAVQHGRLQQEVANLRRMVGGAATKRLLGTSAAIAHAREVLARAAPTDANVLILGESGTGKELAARTLHDLSSRHARPFVAINCGALPSDLLESELFGHVRGAFTGAHRDKEGVFAAANGGTIFLDEVGDAPMPVQVKLLRVLQERTFSPVGAVEPRSVDVRIVAATNRDLARDVEQGEFREDLYYRLHVVPVTMPPLRARKPDIPLLAEVFLREACQQYGLPRLELTPAAMTALVNHSWPGNVRELANVISGAAAMSQNGLLDVEQIAAVKSSLNSPQPSARQADSVGWLDVSSADELPSLRDARERFEQEYLRAALRLCKGNVSLASRVAQRNRSDLHDLLRKHGIQAADYRSSNDD